MRRKRRTERWCMGRELGSCSGVYPTRSQPCSLHSPGTEKAEDGAPRMFTLSSSSFQNEPQRGRDDPVRLFLPWRGSYLRASVEFPVSMETPSTTGPA